MYKVLTLNNISVDGLRRLPRELYEIASEMPHPDGIMVRSFKMHDMEIPDTVKAVASRLWCVNQECREIGTSNAITAT